MPKTIYCWRCKVYIPMLTEEEWQVVSPHITNALTQMKQYREAHHCSLSEVNKKNFGHEALFAYEQITGFKENNLNALFHHRLSIYGSPCHVCGKPLRTPQARYCAMCGAEHQVATETINE